MSKSEVQEFLDWAANLDAESEMPDIFQKLKRLDRFERILMGETTGDELRAVIFELEEEE